jgi:RNA polymerase-binding transcription factor DksA
VDGADGRVAEETSEALGRAAAGAVGRTGAGGGSSGGGTYAASILSGRPIPDKRLEAFPLVELIVDEAATRDRDQEREA